MTPSPASYPFSPSLTPHPFMGLSKFLAGHIHQIRSAKSYLAAHPSLFNRETPLPLSQVPVLPRDLRTRRPSLQVQFTPERALPSRARLARRRFPHLDLGPPCGRPCQIHPRHFHRFSARHVPSVSPRQPLILLPLLPFATPEVFFSGGLIGRWFSFLLFLGSFEP